jgi:hypothetical protein
MYNRKKSTFRKLSFFVRKMGRRNHFIPSRLMKRLKLSMSVSISDAAVLKYSWRFVFSAVHYFFFVVLVLGINSMPCSAAMLIITMTKIFAF